MSRWRPIGSAPKDKVIDLWMVDESGKGWREADAYWVTNRADEQSRYLPDGTWERAHVRRDGWWAPNHDYDGADGFCDQPRFFNAHPRQQRWVFTEATHWMPAPLPPAQPKEINP